MFRRSIVAALTLGAVPLAAAAQDAVREPISMPRQLVPNFDIFNLVPVLDELGIRHELHSDGGDKPYLTASLSDGFAFNIAPTACSSAFSRCIGVNFVALYGADAVTPQTIFAFNQSHAFTSVGLIGESRGVYLLRYELADYGIPRGNFAASLAQFLAVADQFQSALASAPQTVSLQGYAEDFAADGLNRQALSALGGAQTAPRGPHDASLADAVARAEALFRSGAPVNPVGGPKH